MRILTGIQPSGALHLGNYFGMMKPALALQHEGEAYYFIADYHSLTAIQNAAELRKEISRCLTELDSPEALARLAARYRLIILSNVDRTSFAGSNLRSRRCMFST